MLVPPIIVVEGLDISLYPSVAAAELQLEGPDVIAGTYRIYDATGRKLSATSQGGPNDFSAPVRIEDALDGPAPEELKRLLEAHLLARKVTFPGNASLESLLGTVLRLDGFSG